MWRWLTAAALLCAAIGLLLWTIRGREPPDEEYRRALKLLRDGDFDRASESAAAGARHSKSADWRSRFRLLQVDALLESGKGDAAMSLLDSLPPSDSIEQNVRERVLRARRLVGAANLPAAQKLLNEAKRIVHQQNRPDLAGDVELLLGQTFGRQRRLDEAESSFQVARAAAVASGDRFRQAAALTSLGMVQMIRTHCDEAIPLFEEAQNLYREVGANHWVAAARNNIGLCYSQLGDVENALTYRQAALTLSRPSALKANALGETGTVLLADDPAKASNWYRQARDMARQFGALPDAARWSGNLASALAAIHDWDGAESALQEAKRLGAEPPPLCSSTSTPHRSRSDAAGRRKLARCMKPHWPHRPRIPRWRGRRTQV